MTHQSTAAKGSDEQTLFRRLLGNLDAGDVLLGDAYFPTCLLLAALRRLGVDGLFEQYGARQRSCATSRPRSAWRPCAAAAPRWRARSCRCTCSTTT